MPWWGVAAIIVGPLVIAAVMMGVAIRRAPVDPHDDYELWDNEPTQQAIVNGEVWWPGKTFTHRLPDREEW